MQDENKATGMRYHLLVEIYKFLQDNPLIDAEIFGYYASGKYHLIAHLRAGKDIETKRYERVLRFLNDPQTINKRCFYERKSKQRSQRKSGGKPGITETMEPIQKIG